MRTKSFLGWAALAVVVGAASCGTERPESGESHEGVESASVALPSSPEAVSRVEALRARFREVVVAAPGVDLTRARSTPEHVSVLGREVATSFERAGAELVRALIPGEEQRAVRHPASVELPARADGFATLEDPRSGVRVRFALRGAASVPLTPAGGIALYPGALGGADVVHRVHAEGTEDFVVFESQPAEEVITYDVDVSHVPGLRLVEGVLEMLDAEGTPRLRVASPYVVDARGDRRGARLSVEGCAHDASPAAPWGRAVTAPGAARCTVRVAWEGARYPAIVDPAWISAGTMVSKRSSHTATLLGTGKVLLAGGHAGSANAVLTAELHDPTTSTFAATGSMSVRHAGHTASLLGTGKVLIAGGSTDTSATGPTATAHLYDPTAGTFSNTASMPGPRANHSATVLNNGKVLMVSGYDGTYLASAVLYDPTAGTFAATDPLPSVRYGHSATLLPSGKVLVAGGWDGATPTNGALLYDPATGQFGGTGAMPAARYLQGAIMLGTGRVLLAGGDDGTSFLSSALLYNPAGTGTFTATGPMSAPRRTHKLSILGSGKVVVSGGSSGSGALNSTEIYDAAAGTWSAFGTLVVGRARHTETVLASGKVLLTGGSTDSSVTNSLQSAEILDLKAAGAACTYHDECFGVLCEGGICCAGACSGTCKTCEAGTGACVSVVSADDPNSCTGNNSCDAAGACKLKNGQPCAGGPSTCVSGLCADDLCCNTACGGSCDFCDLIGNSGTCSPAPVGDPGAPACTSNLCNGTLTTCPTTCLADADCTPSHYCDQSGTCQPRKAQGGACNLTAGADCKVTGCRECANSLTCVDGYCCGSACGAACDVCDVTPGTCTTAPAGRNTATCGSPQACNGVVTTCPSGCSTDAECATTHYCAPDSTCKPRKTQAAVCNASAGADCKVAGCRVCQSNQCVDGFCCNNGCGPCGSCGIPTAGTCTPRPAHQPPTPAGACGLYLCDGQNAPCASICATNADCIAGNFCLGGQCVSKLPQGSTCSANAECETGFCADGVCCDNACSGICLACAAASKQSGSGNGTCGVAKLGSNPGNQCVVDTTNTCGTVAVCKGTAAECAKAPSGTSCGTTSCTSGNVTGAVCDGQGVCQQNVTASCAPYTCKGAACSSPCAVDTDCVTGHYCANGTCVVQSTNGKACSAANACTSGFCVDAVCCDAPCGGQCQACAEPGSLGTCTTVSGTPRTPRSACDGTSTCHGTCNGDPSACTYPGAATACGPDASCTGDVSQPKGSCDGSGSCATPGTKNCPPYACDAATGLCNTSCVSSSECAQGATCDTISGKCAPTTATCADTFTVMTANGELVSCAPYKCLSGQCQQQCVTQSDCAEGYACKSSSCVESTGTGGAGTGGAGTGGAGGTGGGASSSSSSSSGTLESKGGCGCRTVGEGDGSSSGAAILAAVAALAASRRRSASRRRARRASSS